MEDSILTSVTEDGSALAAVAEVTQEAVVSSSNTFKETLINTLGISSFSSILGALIVLLFCLIFIKIVMSIATRLLNKSKLDTGLRNFLLTVIKACLWILSIISVAGALGIPTASLVALVSVAGLALSLSIQNIMSNLFSGVTIFITKPFAVGNYISVGANSGTVQSIGLFYTVLVTIDNQRITIPNSDVTAAALINYSAEPMRRVDITYSASYESPQDDVRSAIMDAISRIPQISETPAPPFIAVMKYGESSIDYIVRVWCRNEDYWTVYFGLNDSMLDCFAAHGVEMTYNHINVHMVP